MGWICTGCGPRQRSLLCSLDSVRGSFSNQHDSASSAVAGLSKTGFIYLFTSIYSGSFDRACQDAFQKRPASPTFSHTHSHLWEPKASLLLFTERFYLTSRVLIALLRVISTEVTCECASFFILLCPHVPSTGIWRNSRQVKSQILCYPPGWCKNR